MPLQCNFLYLQRGILRGIATWTSAATGSLPAFPAPPAAAVYIILFLFLNAYPQKNFLIRRFPVLPAGAASLALSGDGKYAAAGGNDFTVRLYHLKDGSPHATLTGHTDIVRAVAVSRKRELLASGGIDKSIRVWHPAKGTLLAVLTGHTGYVTSLAFSPDGMTLASGGAEGTIRIWNMKSFICDRVLSAHDYAVNALAFSPDGKTLASGGLDEFIRIWNTADWTQKHEFHGRSNSIRHLVFNRNGLLLAAANFKHTVRLWRVSDAQCVETFPVERNVQVNTCAFSPNGKRLLCGLSNGKIHQWDIKSPKNGYEFQAHSAAVFGMQFSPDAKKLFSFGGDMSIAAWDAGKLASVKMKAEKSARKHKAIKAKKKTSKKGKAVLIKKYGIKKKPRLRR